MIRAVVLEAALNERLFDRLSAGQITGTDVRARLAELDYQLVKGPVPDQLALSGPVHRRYVRLAASDALSAVAAKTRHMPEEFINESGNGVTPAFVEWLRPLVGEMPVIGRI